MLEKPMDVLTAFPVRKSKKQKQAFRDSVQSYAVSLGYTCKTEKGSFGSQNLVIGDPDSAPCLVTAHYDTCTRLPFPNLITPCNFWAFLGYRLLAAVLILLSASGVGFLTGLLVGNPAVGSVTGYVCIGVLIALMLIGPANPSNANDNTSGVITLLEIARTLPKSQRHKVCFVLFDLEEAGAIGSASYRSAHKKATDDQVVLKLDCVGDGDDIRIFPAKKLRNDPKKLSSLYQVCGCFGKKNIWVHEKGFAVYPSSQAVFPYGVEICAFRKSRVGLFLSRIHTNRDTILEGTNVNLLRAALTTYITCVAAQ